MAAHPSLSAREKELIMTRKAAGDSLAQIAAALGIPFGTVRKWWRIGRDGGPAALQRTRPGRRPTGLLSQFSPDVAATALALKHAHPGWGAARVCVALQQTAALAGMRLPKRSQLAYFLHASCPAPPPLPRPPAPAPPPRPHALHVCWQLDCQEGVHLADGTIASICTLREPVGGAILASSAVSVATARHWRKLTWREIQSVIREAATRWGTLPDALQTDNELVLGGSPTDPFPSRLTLWLTGLGVAHWRIRPHTPTDQAQIERTHRTLAQWVGPDIPDLPTLQARLDAEREIHNRAYPSRAGSCAGQPPLVAHPGLLVPRRPYHRAVELVLFDPKRVDALLASLVLVRKVSAVGTISLGRRQVSIGRRYAQMAVRVSYDATERAWVVHDLAHPEQELARRPSQDMDAASLTGLPCPDQATDIPAIQLMLPELVA
jgi:hypothetical protein